jgi:ribonuclease I
MCTIEPKAATVEDGLAAITKAKYILAWSWHPLFCDAAWP